MVWWRLEPFQLEKERGGEWNGRKERSVGRSVESWAKVRRDGERVKAGEWLGGVALTSNASHGWHRERLGRLCFPP